MEEFAAVSGISRPTVSKYFNDPASVRPSTRVRIEQALARHDYRPNIFAVNQNRRMTRNIGILVPAHSDPFFAEVVRLIEARCFQAGFWPVVLTSHGDPDIENKALEMFRSFKAAGAVIVPLGQASGSQRLHAFAAEIPTVIFDSEADAGEAFVGTDNSHSVGLMVDYLCQSGEPPCFLEMPPVTANAREREQAYVAAMSRQGFEPKILRAGGKGWDFEQIGHAAGMRLISGRKLPSATVLCANDRLAIGMLAAAYEKGLRVGTGPGCALRIAGHDDHPLARFTCPPLTTVAQDHLALAEACADLLFGIIDSGRSGGSRPVLRLKGRLVLRDSA